MKTRQGNNHLLATMEDKSRESRWEDVKVKLRYQRIRDTKLAQQHIARSSPATRIRPTRCCIGAWSKIDRGLDVRHHRQSQIVNGLNSTRLDAFEHKVHSELGRRPYCAQQIRPIDHIYSKTRMSYEQANPRKIRTQQRIYTANVFPHHIWLLSKKKQRNCAPLPLSFGIYLQRPCFPPISQSVRIQLPLKTQYAVNAPCPSSANAKMMSKKRKVKTMKMPRT